MICARQAERKELCIAPSHAKMTRSGRTYTTGFDLCRARVRCRHSGYIALRDIGDAAASSTAHFGGWDPFARVWTNLSVHTVSCALSGLLYSLGRSFWYTRRARTYRIAYVVWSSVYTRGIVFSLHTHHTRNGWIEVVMIMMIIMMMRSYYIYTAGNGDD